ncbi:MAG: MBL fold metallo-hydrolase [Clostridiales bacterium]|jgi:competence protein ComEC|nr:MBL fold metallo-hydrolase [Clostridiales bacterium]
MRKLAIASIAFSAAVYMSHYLVPPEFLMLFGAVCAVLSLAGLFLKSSIRRSFLLITVAAALGFSISFISYVSKTLPARDVSDSEQKITARVTDFPSESEKYAKVSIRLTGDNVPNLNAMLYSFDKDILELLPGDIINADVKLKTADERYGEPFSRDNARNIYLRCYLNGGIEVIGKSPLAFLYFPKSITKNIKESAVRVFPEDSAPFIIALLTGDKELLYADVKLYSDMAATGILHVVAVSGMHVAFLVGFIQMLIRRKKLASMIGIPLVWLFVPITGATPSVVRAAFMQSMVLTAPLFGRENDGITSLSAVLAALLLINPNACASVGLQLSFAATAGIILATPKINKALLSRFSKFGRSSRKGSGIPGRVADKALKGVCAAFSATIGALIFSTPVSVLYFGYVSVIGILVNILIFWAISICFIFGYIACFIGLIWLPAGTFIGALTSVFVRYIIAVVGAGASVPYAAVYTESNVFGYWLVLVYIVFILCYAFRRKEGFRAIIPVCIAVSSFCCVIIFTEYSAKNDTGTFIAADVGQGQSLIFTVGNATAVIDCGGKSTNNNAGDTVASLLLGSGRKTVDVLALTHFDEDHVNGAVRLMARMNVRCLVVPDGYFDRAAREEVLSAAEKYGVQVYIIREDAVITAGDLKINVYTTKGRDEYGLMFMACLGDFEAFISGDATISEEQRFLINHTLPDTELFVAGHHGSKYSSCDELLNALNAEYVIVSCGYNSYGHPTEEALKRFKNAGMEIYRTDQMGTISVKIGG